MATTKKIAFRYASLAIHTWVACILLLAISACSCSKATRPGVGQLNLHVDKEKLQGIEKAISLSFDISPSDKAASLDALISQYKLQIHIEVLQGPKGMSSITYKAHSATESGGEVVVQESEVHTKSLAHFLSVDRDASSTSASLQMPVVLSPGPQVVAMRVTFQLLDGIDNDRPLGEACVVTWQANPVSAYTFDLKDVDSAGVLQDYVFEIMAGRGGQALEKEDVRNLTVVVTTLRGDATIQGLTNTVIHFQDTDILADKGGILYKKLTIQPGTVDTEFSLQLYHNQQPVQNAVKNTTWKASAMPSHRMIIDKHTLEDDNNTFKVTVQQGEARKKTTKTKRLQLKISRTLGTEAKIKDSKGSGSDYRIGLDAFKDGNLQSATKDLVILPGADKKAAFEIQLVDKKGHTIGVPQTVCWGSTLALDVRLSYDPIQERFTYRINNVGKAIVPKILLLWERISKDKVELKYNSQGKILQAEKGEIELGDLSSNGIMDGKLDVVWQVGHGHATFLFKVLFNQTHTYQEEAYNDKFSFIKETPHVQIKLSKSDNNVYIGKRKIDFIISAGEKDLTEYDLSHITLQYAPSAKGRLLQKNEDVNNKSLAALLGVNKLAAKSSRELSLDVDNNDEREVVFNDVYLKGSATENSHKIKEVKWQGVAKVVIRESKKKGDKQVAIKFTNESGFPLQEKDLRKLIFVLTGLTPGASVKYDGIPVTSERTTLWDLLKAPLGSKKGTINPLEKKRSACRDLEIENGDNGQVDFYVSLAGTEEKGYTHEAVPVSWEGDIKIKIKNKTSGPLVGEENKTFTLDFINESGFSLSKSVLEKLTLVTKDLPSGVVIKYNDTPITPHTSLWKLLGKSLESSAGISGLTQLTVDTGKQKSVKFKIGITIEKGHVKSEDIGIEWKEKNEIRLSKSWMY